MSKRPLIPALNQVETVHRLVKSGQDFDETMQLDLFRLLAMHIDQINDRLDELERE